MEGMKLSDVKTIAVCGSGTMGIGIAQLCIAAGYQTLFFDINPGLIEKGFEQVKKNLTTAVEKGKFSSSEYDDAISRLKPVFDPSVLKCDLAIEAIVENLEAKRKLFSEIASVNANHTILATNTSSIPITKIAQDIPHPERVVGMHFFNPAHIMKLVEVISGDSTSEDVADLIFQLAEQFDKKPVRAKDRPGFIVNRIGKMYHTEPIKLIEDGVAEIETVDNLLEGLGFKMGPFRLIDLIGVDANLNVTKSLFELIKQPQFAPSALQQQLVEEGRLGRKSGSGFYEYSVK